MVVVTFLSLAFLSHFCFLIAFYLIKISLECSRVKSKLNVFSLFALTNESFGTIGVEFTTIPNGAVSLDM